MIHEGGIRSNMISAQELPGTDRLPTSSTCTRELFWPVTSSIGKTSATHAFSQQVRERLLHAIESAGDGFHLA
jgi:hypothetical protein